MGVVLSQKVIVYHLKHIKINELIDKDNMIKIIYLYNQLIKKKNYIMKYQL